MGRLTSSCLSPIMTMLTMSHTKVVIPRYSIQGTGLVVAWSSASEIPYVVRDFYFRHAGVVLQVPQRNDR